MIEVLIPDQPSQIYPDAVLRSLLREGKVEPSWAARTVGAESWSTIAAVLNAPTEAKVKSEGDLPAATVSANTEGGCKAGSRARHPKEGRISKRYAHGQKLVSGLEGKAAGLEVLGKVAAFLITIICALLPAMVSRSPGGAVLVGLIIGLVLGIIVFKILESRATLLRLQASLLAATIDTAVYACPYLSDEARLSLICPPED